MNRRVELLVHAGAPSTLTDDRRYQAQANACMLFKGRRVEHNANITADDRSTALDLELRPQSSIPTFIDDTQLAFTALESQLIDLPLSVGRLPYTTPVQDRPALYNDERLGHRGESSDPSSNAAGAPSSPVRKHKSSADEHVVGSGTSHGDAAAPSSYLTSPVLPRANKKLKSPQQHGDLRALIAPHAGLLDIQSQRLSEERQPPSLASHAPSELPTSYSLSDVTSESSKAQTRTFQRTASDPGAHGDQTGAVQDVESSVEAGNRELRSQNYLGELLHNARKSNDGVPHVQSAGNRRQAARESSGAYTPAHSALQLLKPLDDRTAIPGSNGAAQFHAPDCTLQELPMSISPPGPILGLDAFVTHATRHLIMLAERLPESFKPSAVHRVIDPLERGHWAFDPSTWSAQAQIDLWRFLEKTVGDGHAGWGVWCIRDGGSNGDSTSTSALGKVKVFCWGEVVRHVYLMLYVASTSQIRRLGLQWVDAEGRTVLQMRGQ